MFSEKVHKASSYSCLFSQLETEFFIPFLGKEGLSTVFGVTFTAAVVTPDLPVAVVYCMSGCFAAMAILTVRQRQEWRRVWSGFYEGVIWSAIGSMSLWLPLLVDVSVNLSTMICPCVSRGRLTWVFPVQSLSTWVLPSWCFQMRVMLGDTVVTVGDSRVPRLRCSWGCLRAAS